MKSTVLLSLTALLALPVWAGDAADDVKSAAKKLADQSNYTWTTKTDPAPGGGGGGGGGGRGGGRFGGGGGPTEGKIAKDGFMVLTYKMGDNTTEIIVKGDKAAIKEGDEWKTTAELGDAGGGGGGGQGRGNFAQALARRAPQIKAPATQAQELAGQVTGLKKDGDAYAGDLTAEAIKQMYTRGGRPGQAAGGDAGTGPDTSGLKGTAKFWVKDGILSKFENHVEGKMTGGRNNQEIEVNRTTTVEIKDIGSTKLDVPAEAKKKLTSG